MHRKKLPSPHKKTASGHDHQPLHYMFGVLYQFGIPHIQTFPRHPFRVLPGKYTIFIRFCQLILPVLHNSLFNFRLFLY